MRPASRLVCLCLQPPRAASAALCVIAVMTGPVLSVAAAPPPPPPAAGRITPPPTEPPRPAAAPAPSAPAGVGLGAAASAAAAAPIRISRSRGVPGGVVVLWPRVVPGTLADETRAQVAGVQQRMAALVARALPGVAVDVRPEAERVCPQAGCLGAAFGAVFTRRRGGCVVLATVSPPGRSPARLLPWGGVVELKAVQAAFRSPPESQITIRDYVPCGELLSTLDKTDEPMAHELQLAARQALAPAAPAPASR